MPLILTLLSTTVSYFLMAIQVAIMARVILGFFLPGDDSAVSAVLWFITEPFLLPFRMLLDRFNVGGGLLDFSPVLATVVITVVMIMLP